MEKHDFILEKIITPLWDNHMHGKFWISPPMPSIILKIIIEFVKKIKNSILIIPIEIVGICAMIYEKN